MTMQRVDKTSWVGFCNMLTAELLDKRAEIEAPSPDRGVGLRWLRFVGVTYDPGSEVMEIALDGLSHMVFHPSELYVERGPRGVESFGIVEGASACEIVLIREPMRALPRNKVH